MDRIDRRTFIRGLGAAVALAPGLTIAPDRAEAQSPPPNPQLSQINRSFLVSSDQARDWHKEKDRLGGPTIAGSPSWHNFLQLTERELRAAGTVRAIGLGVNEIEVCIELLEHCELDCILLAGRYTLLEQPALEKLLPLCVERGVSILCGGPFNSGILAAGSRAGARAHYNYAPPPDAVLERVRRLEALSGELSVPLQAAALQFPLAHPAVASVVAGCVTGAEARHCAAMFAHPIPAGFWDALRDRGLVDPRAPVPA